VQTFVIMLTKNEPIRKTYYLDETGQEQVEETFIEEFEPYSRVIYILAESEKDAQLKVFEHMRLNYMQDWNEIEDGTILD
jgi:DNA-binding PadR family transcriptional regulator